MKISFAQKCPDKVHLWHKEKNGDLRPEDVSYGSGKRVWWCCQVSDDHEWLATIKDIRKGRGCPYCAGQRVCVSNCLATLKPDIALLWHPTKNGKLTPYDVTANSSKKMWWQCIIIDKHEWIDKINNITRGCGCPYCSGHKICVSNCLQTLRPDIASMWHPTKNGTLTTYDVTIKSSKRVWWRCGKNNNHIWQAIVASVSNGTGCPTCNQSHGERWIESWLLTNNIRFTPQYKIPECKNKRPLPFDFAAFVNGNLMLIEFNGIQHFQSVEHFGGEKSLKSRQRNDKIKQSFCLKHNIPFLVLDYTQNDLQMDESMQTFIYGLPNIA